ncbi:hypothetical protein BJY04DRAFT_177265 [Aspergillus karnatakaensis]|uniref:uncharacterized protein n=1 Tax=Aspergillus karnatakaensis TaxID=1810916 RepID=UPI003CCD1E15
MVGDSSLIGLETIALSHDGGVNALHATHCKLRNEIKKRLALSCSCFTGSCVHCPDSGLKRRLHQIHVGGAPESEDEVIQGLQSPIRLVQTLAMGGMRFMNEWPIRSSCIHNVGKDEES